MSSKAIFTVTLSGGHVSIWGNMRLSGVPEPANPIPLLGETLQKTIRNFIESYGYSISSISLKPKRTNSMNKDYTVTILLA